MKRQSAFWKLKPLTGEFQIRTPGDEVIGAIKPDGENFYVHFKERGKDFNFSDSDLMVCVGYVRGIERAMEFGIKRKRKDKPRRVR